MNTMKFATKAVALCASVAALISALPQRAQAQTMPVCPASGSISLVDFGNDPTYQGNCAGTPSVYGLTFYEMGFCQSDPMSSGTFDPTSAGCVATFQSPGGEYHDIAGATVTLGSDAGTERPADGDYSVAYVVFRNVFTLKGTYSFAAGGGAGASTWVSNGDPTSETASNAASSGSAQEFTDTLTSFDETCDPDWAEPQSNGTLNAYITTGSLSSGLSVDTSCSSATTMVGALVLNTPITINSSTTGLQVDFSVTNNGLSVMGSIAGGNPGFGSGPFSATFTVLN